MVDPCLITTRCARIWSRGARGGHVTCPSFPSLHYISSLSFLFDRIIVALPQLRSYRDLVTAIDFGLLYGICERQLTAHPNFLPGISLVTGLLDSREVKD